MFDKLLSFLCLEPLECTHFQAVTSVDKYVITWRPELYLSSPSRSPAPFRNRSVCFCLRPHRWNSDRSSVAGSNRTDRQLRRRRYRRSCEKNGSPSAAALSWMRPCWLLEDVRETARRLDVIHTRRAAAQQEFRVIAVYINERFLGNTNILYISHAP